MQTILVLREQHSCILFVPGSQGLSQDFKTAHPTQRRFQNNPSNPFWESISHADEDFCEPGSCILQPGSLRKKKYNTMEAPMMAVNDGTWLIKLK